LAGCVGGVVGRCQKKNVLNWARLSLALNCSGEVEAMSYMAMQAAATCLAVQGRAPSWQLYQEAYQKACGGWRQTWDNLTCPRQVVRQWQVTSER